MWFTKEPEWQEIHNGVYVSDDGADGEYFGVVSEREITRAHIKAGILAAVLLSVAFMAIFFLAYLVFLFILIGVLCGLFGKRER